MEKFKDVIAGDTLVPVDFYATWCQPCRAMHPVLQDVKQALGDKVRILKIDIDQYQALATEYRIQSVPTLMIFRKGEQLWRQSGMMSKPDLLATLDPFISGM